jgi:hypothetical protein
MSYALVVIANNEIMIPQCFHVTLSMEQGLGGSRDPSVQLIVFKPAKPNVLIIA